ncbi:unnamed protein product [Prorocentrum cordatum]|uniref:Uncharacterized protein n=1 Tax=Prorocentrum cordatum TaxID=2364126 RepID=A0ABN9PB36_9DINO|nr:unnamed protein product [Polarella glacialis]
MSRLSVTSGASTLAMLSPRRTSIRSTCTSTNASRRLLSRLLIGRLLQASSSRSPGVSPSRAMPRIRTIARARAAATTSAIGRITTTATDIVIVVVTVGTRANTIRNPERPLDRATRVLMPTINDNSIRDQTLHGVQSAEKERLGNRGQGRTMGVDKHLYLALRGV